MLGVLGFFEILSVVIVMNNIVKQEDLGDVCCRLPFLDTFFGQILEFDGRVDIVLIAIHVIIAIANVVHIIGLQNNPKAKLAWVMRCIVVHSKRNLYERNCSRWSAVEYVSWRSGHKQNHYNTVENATKQPTKSIFGGASLCMIHDKQIIKQPWWYHMQCLYH